MLNVRGVVLGRVPDVLDRVVVGRVRWQMDRCDAFQQPAGLVEAGQRFLVVGSGVVEDDCDLLCLGFALESFQREDCLLGVLVALDRVQFDFFAGQREGAEEGLGRLLPVHGPVWCVVLSGAACGGSRPRARGGPRLPCRPPSRRPTGH